MHPTVRRAVAALAVLGSALSPVAASAAGRAAPRHPDVAPAGQTVVVRGLDDPREVQFGPDGSLYVANSGGGALTHSAGHGGKGQTIVDRIATAGVLPRGSSIFALAAEATSGPEQKLYKVDPSTGSYRKVANLLSFEKAHNPDGQSQTGGDSLSDPYYLLGTTHDVFVADAGGNDVVAYHDGRLHTYTAFPNIRDTPKCKNAKNNDPQHPGCDAVPTGIAESADRKHLYVSLYGGDASPGAGRIVELAIDTGAVVRTWRHLTGVTGVAVSPHGVVYASELMYGLNSSHPDLDTTGRIVRIAAEGDRTYAQLSTPSSLAWHGGALYAASHAVDEEYGGSPGTGVVVKLAASAFTAG